MNGAGLVATGSTHASGPVAFLGLAFSTQPWACGREESAQRDESEAACGPGMFEEGMLTYFGQISSPLIKKLG